MAVGTGGGGRGVAKNSRVSKQRHIDQCIAIWLKYANSRQWILENTDILMYRIVSF